jgi:hypothetical protein
MSEQLLEQVRDAVEGQIVGDSICYGASGTKLTRAGL